MNRRLPFAILRMLAVAAVALAAAPARAAAPDSSASAVALGPGSRLWIEGTSTLHEYESETHDVTVSYGRDPAATPVADAAGLEALVRAAGIRSIDVDVPVLSLRSKKSGLDKNLWRSLEAKDHPVIRCRLTHVTALPGASNTDTLRIRGEGTLEVAGQVRPIVLEARGWRDVSGLWVSGSHSMLMSGFGIKPPTMMMGALRVADRVTVSYRLLLKPTDGAAGSSRAVGHEKGAER